MRINKKEWDRDYDRLKRAKKKAYVLYLEEKAALYFLEKALKDMQNAFGLLSKIEAKRAKAGIPSLDTRIAQLKERLTEHEALLG